MSTNNTLPVVPGEGIALPHPTLITRGLRREQQKQHRLKARVQGALIVGIDLAREHQAISYHAEHVVARRRLRCHPSQLGSLLWEEAESLRHAHGRDRVLFAMEPAGHYWGLLAEDLLARGGDYVLVHTLAVKREREATRFNPEKRDPRDADLISQLCASARIIEAQLPPTRAQAQLDAYAREYLLMRKACAAEKTRLGNFWDRLLPELTEVLQGVNGLTALCIARALTDFTTLSRLSVEQWEHRVKAFAPNRQIQRRRVRALFERIQAAHAALHRRMTDALPLRIRAAAERWVLFDQQKQTLAEEILRLYQMRPEAAYLDSIPGSLPLYNALTVGLVGDFRRYDDPRAIVKLAGSEVNENASGDRRRQSRISHRGRNPLRSVANQQARWLIRSNPDFGQRYSHLRTRLRNPLQDQQARVALGNSYLRIAHVLLTQNTLYVPLAERHPPTPMN